MNSVVAPPIAVWRPTAVVRWLWVVVAVALTCVFFDGIKFMVHWWYDREEYSHGFLIPPVVAFMIWQKRDKLERVPLRGSWVGVAVVALGLLTYLAGELSTLYTIVQYAFVSVLVGLTLAWVGKDAFKVIWMPLALLLLMVPLPNFLYHNLSASLQLLSSYIGVQFIRLFDIGVLLSGNVIDLGTYRLQVVEACNGLRYLFPLITLGIIVASFFKATWWKRLLLVVSTVPITVLMNSLRIGIIGVTVEYWGQEMAEGILHDVEGWAMFMACFGILLGEAWLLNAWTVEKLPFREVFAIDYPAPTPANAVVERQGAPVQFLVSVLLIGLMTIPAFLLPQRVENTPSRADFATFPLQLDAWQGRREVMGQEYINELRFTDYWMANYVRDGSSINLYAAYYESQRKGQSVHSPRTCLPGGGWQLMNLTQVPVTTPDNTTQWVNRVEIQLGTEKQLVYYWFRQRGRQITNEYLVKWFLFWDALTINRSDGALVRLITPIRTGESVEEGEQRLQAFARVVIPELKNYIPE